MAVESVFAAAPRIPKDAIFALTARYNQDKSSMKVNLGQGTYRDDKGLPWILPSVAEARRRVMNSKLDHEYLPILGLADLRQAAARLVLGRSAWSSLSSRVASSQSLSGTGGLHLAGLLIKSCSSLKPEIWVPEPTWSNHQLVFSSLGFKCRSFSYYDFGTKRLDMRSYKQMLQTAEPGSIVILHACAHNPTGCDPSQEQWREIGQTMKQRGLFPLFDAAYLGFNSGSVDNDAYAIRYFVNELSMEALISVSFAKSMGLYGERVGCTFLVAKNKETADNTESVLERLQRSEVSNPPAFGAKIASTILNDDKLTQMWSDDLVTMCTRIRLMRETLSKSLVAHGAPGHWDHILNQSGMFSFLGLPLDIVVQLKEEYHIYMADNSRISLAGLNTSNVEYVANSIAQALQSSSRDRTGGKLYASL